MNLFDLRTVYLALCLAFYAIAVGLLTTTLSSPRALRGARVLASSYLAGGTAWGLFILRGRIHTLFNVLASNLLLILGIALLYVAVCRLLNLRFLLWPSLAALGLAATVLLIYGWANPDYQLRVGWLSLIMAGQMFHIGWTLLRRPAEARLGSEMLTGGFLFVFSLMFIARAVAGLTHSLPDSSVLQPSLHNLLISAFALVANLLLPFAFLLISNEQHFRHLQVLAGTDALTGVLNRHALLESLNLMILDNRRLGQSLSLGVVDVDGFKTINDQFGHSVGDAILTQIAARLQGLVRQSDRLGRYGGDEFLLLLPNTNLEHAFNLATRLRDQFERKPFEAKGIPHLLTLSIGVACMQPDDTPDTLLLRADQAMYQAKENRNHVAIAGE